MSISLAETGNFIARHPELGSFIPGLVGTYTTCKPGDWDATFDDMYAHIYGCDGQQSCSWCKARLERHIEYSQQFIK